MQKQYIQNNVTINHRMFMWNGCYYTTVKA